MADLRSDQAAAPAPPQSPGRTPRTPGERPAVGRLGSWLVVAVPVLAELAVGGYRISGPSFWRDEGYTIVGAQRPVGAILHLVQNQDAFHGLYLLLMHPVIATFGRSEMALRVPSLIAMSVAAGLTAALARRLARTSGLAGAPAIGLVAGLLLVGLPVTTRYAQEGRPYALTVMFALLTTYLLLVASQRSGWRWWALYGAGLLVTSLFDLAAVMLAGAHGVSLVAARRGGQASSAQANGAQANGARPDSALAAADGAHTYGAQDQPAAARIADLVVKRWFAACVAVAIVLSPVVIFSFQQRAQLDWVQRPNLGTINGLLHDLAGVTLLIPIFGVLALLGCLAAPGLRRGRGPTLALVCLPWWFLPPSLLLLISLVHPDYVDRYILYSVPAFVILVSAGLVWIAALAGRLLAGRMSVRRARVVAVVPSAALAVLTIVMMIGPQAAIRQPNSRADNIRVIASILSIYERPGDAILYLPRKTAVIGRAYPDPFNKLRDIGQLTGPIASGTLLGVPAGPRMVAARLRGVRRVWTVEWVHPLAPDSAPPLSLVGLLRPMHMVGSWLIQSVLLVLYAAPAR
jgi:mannosyltransferase